MAELKRVLSYKVILLIVINSIMGTGIFFLPALGAKKGGPASLISWVIFSLISIYIAMCFGELTSMYPRSGGVYEFSKQVYGRFGSFLIGWTNLITENLTIAMLILGAIRYLVPAGPPVLSIAVSIALIFAFSAIAYRGMQVSATMLVTFSLITIGTILAIIIPGFFTFDAGNLTPFIPFGGISIFLTIFFIAETFFGWESPTFLAGEVKDGEKVMPKALIHGTIIISLISLVFVFVSMGSLGWERFADAPAPISAIAGLIYGPAGVKAFSLLVYLAIIGSVASWVVSAPRLILSMAKDRLFPSRFQAIHPTLGTPYKAIILQFLISSALIIVGAGSYYTLLHLLVPLLIMMYCMVLLSVVILRYKKPDHPRHYRAPLGKTGPIIIIVIFLSLLLFWLMDDPTSIDTLLFALSLVALGIPLFFLLEVYYDPTSVRRFDNIFAYVALFTERIMVPKKVREEIIRLIGDSKDKKVLEFGCSVGTFTLRLAEAVGKGGRVYATDISEVNVAIAKKRFEKRDTPHIVTIHDRHHAVRVHPDVPIVDNVVGIATLGYVQNIRDVLLHMNRRLPVGGKVCFVEYDRFFHFLPTVDWLSLDQRITHYFRDSGFNVRVERRRGLLWENIYIYGTKQREVQREISFDPDKLV